MKCLDSQRFKFFLHCYLVEKSINIANSVGSVKLLEQYTLLVRDQLEKIASS